MSEDNSWSSSNVDFPSHVPSSLSYESFLLIVLASQARVAELERSSLGSLEELYVETFRSLRGFHSLAEATKVLVAKPFSARSADMAQRLTGI